MRSAVCQRSVVSLEGAVERVQTVSPGSPLQRSSENTHQFPAPPRPREQLHPVYQPQNKSSAWKSGKGKRLQAASVKLHLNLDVNFSTSVEGLGSENGSHFP